MTQQKLAVRFVWNLRHIAYLWSLDNRANQQLTLIEMHNTLKYQFCKTFNMQCSKNKVSNTTQRQLATSKRRWLMSWRWTPTYCDLLITELTNSFRHLSGLWSQLGTTYSSYNVWHHKKLSTVKPQIEAGSRIEAGSQIQAGVHLVVYQLTAYDDISDVIVSALSNQNGFRCQYR